MSTSWRHPALGFLLLVLAAATGTAQSTGEHDPTAVAVEALQNQILSDPKLAAQVHALSDDPQVREILSDPAISDALNRGDFGAILANPKIRRLAEDPAVQSITRDVAPPQ